MLDSLLTALNTLNEGDFAGTGDCIPQPYLQGAAEIETSKYDLPSVLVPPEIIEVEGMTSETGSEAQIKKEEWPEYYFRIFTTDVSSNFFRPEFSIHLLRIGFPRPNYARRIYYPQYSD